MGMLCRYWACVLGFVFVRAVLILGGVGAWYLCGMGEGGVRLVI